MQVEVAMSGPHRSKNSSILRKKSLEILVSRPLTRCTDEIGRVAGRRCICRTSKPVIVAVGRKAFEMMNAMYIINITIAAYVSSIAWATAGDRLPRIRGGSWFSRMPSANWELEMICRFLKIFFFIPNLVIN